MFVWQEPTNPRAVQVSTLVVHQMSQLPKSSLWTGNAHDLLPFWPCTLHGTGHEEGMTRSSIALFFVVLAVGCSGSEDPGSEDSPETGSGGGGTSATGGMAPIVGSGGGDQPGGTGGAVAGSGGNTNIPPKDGPRVVGYLPTYRSLDPARIDFDTLTHLCIAFANPTTPDQIDFDAPPASINALVAAAHAKGVQVLVSIAGAAGGASVETAIQPGSVDTFITALLDLVSRYELDGIDVDIEGSHVQAVTYTPFVTKLSAALPEGKLLTAAVATWNGDDFPDAALAEFDFINLMSYDHCGTWSDACEHSLYSESLSELQYWENQRGIPADRMVLGVPFYGYCWGSSCPAGALTYPEILAFNPEGRTNDYLMGAGYTISLNGPATLAQKVELSKMHGGIMIWELGQDGTGEDSLFSVIAAGY